MAATGTWRGSEVWFPKEAVSSVNTVVTEPIRVGKLTEEEGGGEE